MNQEKKAVAVKYNSGEKAPKIIAKGKKKLAEKIVEIAREYNIPIENNKALVDALIDLDIEDYIPEEFYPIIAEILAFVYKLKVV